MFQGFKSDIGSFWDQKKIMIFSPKNRWKCQKTGVQIGKKIGKKMGNDDLFLIFSNFCYNCTFYMRSKYVGGMVWQFLSRVHPVYAPKRYKHSIFRFGRILAFLAKKIFCVKCALCVQILSDHSRIWKPNTWWVFWSTFHPSKKLENFSEILLEKLKIFG